MRTLAYHAGALGDFIATLPTLDAWRARDPEGRVTLLGKPAFAELIMCNAVIDEVWDVECGRCAPLFNADSKLPPGLADSLHAFDAAILFADNDSPVVAHARQAGIGTILLQPPFSNDRISIARYHLRVLEGCVDGRHDADPVVTLDPAREKEALRLLPPATPVVAMHPGSGGARKNWPLERFAELAERLGSDGLAPLWILGPAEDQMVLDSRHTVLRNLPLPVVAHVLHTSSLYVGNDSGISHLAAAVGCRSVILFGASDPGVWAPPGRNVTIVRHETDCAPCHPIRGASECGLQCMEAITVDEVLRACRAMYLSR